MSYMPVQIYEKSVIEQINNKALNYVKYLFKGNQSHGIRHVQRVLENAKNIADTEEGCDLLVVCLAAILHDCDDYKYFNTKANNNSRQFLSSLQQEYPNVITDAVISEVLLAINSVSYHDNGCKRLDNINARIVQDADRLDSLGVFGVIRAFTYIGEKGMTEIEGIKHIEEKCLHLYENLQTSGGRTIGKERHNFIKTFIKVCEMEYRNYNQI